MGNELKKCNHFLGVYETQRLFVSNIVDFIDDAISIQEYLSGVGYCKKINTPTQILKDTSFVDWFKFCPICGEKLDIKLIYKKEV